MHPVKCLGWSVPPPRLEIGIRLRDHHAADSYASVRKLWSSACRRAGGRTFGVNIPMFIAGFAQAEVVGTCEKLADSAAPVWSKVHFTNVEALGCDTLGHDPDLLSGNSPKKPACGQYSAVLSGDSPWRRQVCSPSPVHWWFA
jgi:hypothetical protein